MAINEPSFSSIFDHINKCNSSLECLDRRCMTTSGLVLRSYWSYYFCSVSSWCNMPYRSWIQKLLKPAPFICLVCWIALAAPVRKHEGQVYRVLRPYITMVQLLLVFYFQLVLTCSEELVLYILQYMAEGRGSCISNFCLLWRWLWWWTKILLVLETDNPCFYLSWISVCHADSNFMDRCRPSHAGVR